MRKTIFVRKENLETWDKALLLSGNISELISMLLEKWLNEKDPELTKIAKVKALRKELGL